MPRAARSAPSVAKMVTKRTKKRRGETERSTNDCSVRKPVAGCDGIEAAEREQDAAGKSLRIHARADDEGGAFDISILCHWHVDLRTGLLFESAFAHVGDHTDHTRRLFPGAVRKFSNRVFPRPLAARARFIHDDDRLIVRYVVP